VISAVIAFVVIGLVAYVVFFFIVPLLLGLLFLKFAINQYKKGSSVLTKLIRALVTVLMGWAIITGYYQVILELEEKYVKKDTKSKKKSVDTENTKESHSKNDSETKKKPEKTKTSKAIKNQEEPEAPIKVEEPTVTQNNEEKKE
jgi:predicted membrane protein